MRKEILWYGLIMSVVLIVMKLLEVSFHFRSISIEIYLSVVAITFLVLGLWFGQRPKKEHDSIHPFDEDHLQSRLNALGISDREYEVICKLAEGLSNKEIADQLFLSESTVKTHLANVFSKLNAKRRTEVIKIARSEGIIG